MNFCRTIGSLSLSLICLTISCKTVVSITGVDLASQKLTLQKKDGSPADTIKVKENDKVLWRIKTNKVHSITRIADEVSEAKPVFLTDRTPHKKFLSRSWVFKVNRISKDEFKNTGYVNEFYFISWKPKAADSTITYDPLMQIYPRTP